MPIDSLGLATLLREELGEIATSHSHSSSARKCSAIVYDARLLECRILGDRVTLRLSGGPSVLVNDIPHLERVDAGDIEALRAAIREMAQRARTGIPPRFLAEFEKSRHTVQPWPKPVLPQPAPPRLSFKEIHKIVVDFWGDRLTAVRTDDYRMTGTLFGVFDFHYMLEGPHGIPSGAVGLMAGGGFNDFLSRQDGFTANYGPSIIAELQHMEWWCELRLPEGYSPSRLGA